MTFEAGKTWAIRILLSDHGIIVAITRLYRDNGGLPLSVTSRMRADGFWFVDFPDDHIDVNYIFCALHPNRSPVWTPPQRIDNDKKLRLLSRGKTKTNQCTSDVLSEIAAFADPAIQEIRTTSYLLHPPLLDKAGFNSAAQWYVDGFGERSGIKVRLDLATKRERGTGA